MLNVAVPQIILDQAGVRSLICESKAAGMAQHVGMNGHRQPEGGIEPIERLIRQLSNPPERMVRRDPLLDRDVGEQGAGSLLLASLKRSCGCFIFASGAGLLSELLGRWASWCDRIR